MNCEQAKGLIVEFLYDELPSESVSKLQTHLAECESCMKYKEELQHTILCLDQVEEEDVPVDLMDLHDEIDRKQHRVWKFFRRRWPVWVPIGACLSLLLIFALFVSEIHYENGALAVRFNGQETTQLAEKTEKMLAAYREDQLHFQRQVTDELRTSTTSLLKVINEYETQRDKQLVSAFLQMLKQQNQMLLATQKEFETRAAETDEKLRRNYLQTVATVSGLMDSP